MRFLAVRLGGEMRMRRASSETVLEVHAEDGPVGKHQLRQDLLATLGQTGNVRLARLPGLRRCPTKPADCSSFKAILPTRGRTQILGDRCSDYHVCNCSGWLRES